MATNVPKNTAAPSNRVRPGQGYAYDSYLTSDEDPDPLSGNARMYDQIGFASTPTNVNKNSASATNVSKT